MKQKKNRVTIVHVGICENPPLQCKFLFIRLSFRYILNMYLVEISTNIKIYDHVKLS